MSECVCGSIITNRVGIVEHHHHGELYRFALDCPIHGIESDRAEPIVLKEDFGRNVRSGDQGPQRPQEAG